MAVTKRLRRVAVAGLLSASVVAVLALMAVPRGESGAKRTTEDEALSVARERVPRALPHVRAYDVVPNGRLPGVAANAANGESGADVEYARGFDGKELPDLGLVNPLEGAGITHDEAEETLKLFHELQERQEEIDRRERLGEIDIDEHARLSAALEAEMNRRFEDVLGPERVRTFEKLAQEWGQAFMRKYSLDPSLVSSQGNDDVE